MAMFSQGSFFSAQERPRVVLGTYELGRTLGKGMSGKVTGSVMAAVDNVKTIDYTVGKYLLAQHYEPAITSHGT